MNGCIAALNLMSATFRSRISGAHMSLSKTQLKHLETRLHQERVRLIDQLNAFEDVGPGEDAQVRSGDLSKLPTHPADLGTDVIGEEIELSIGTRVSAELVEIDAAVDRLLTTPERFGMDEQTGLPIPFERLDLIPYARTNVAREPAPQ